MCLARRSTNGEAQTQNTKRGTDHTNDTCQCFQKMLLYVCCKAYVVWATSCFMVMNQVASLLNY